MNDEPPRRPSPVAEGYAAGGARDDDELYAALDDPRFAGLSEHFIDMDGNPIGVREWATRYGDFKSRIIAEDRILREGEPDVEVRTMWTGIIDDGGHLPFGTATGTGPTLRVLEEYRTKDEALAGHSWWVAAFIVGEEPS